MPSREIVAAIIERFNTFAYSGKPLDLWTGVVPTKRADGSAVDLPVAVIFDDGGSNDTTYEHSFLTTKNVRITVAAVTKTACINAVLGILFNGGGPADGLGLHFAASLPFAANSYVLKHMRLTNDWKAEELKDRSGNALRVWGAYLNFEVIAQYTG